MLVYCNVLLRDTFTGIFSLGQAVDSLDHCLRLKELQCLLVLQTIFLVIIASDDFGCGVWFCKTTEFFKVIFDHGPQQAGRLFEEQSAQNSVCICIGLTAHRDCERVLGEPRQIWRGCDGFLALFGHLDDGVNGVRKLVRRLFALL